MAGVLAAIVSTIILVLGFIVFSKPRPKSFAAPELLIVAAHSDDCAIMGAEVASDVLQRGGRVTIVHFTCSGPDPKSEIAQTRAQEAKAAWDAFAPGEIRPGEIRPGEIRIVPVGLPESPVHGPASYADAHMDHASDLIADIMRALPAGSVVLIPAGCESHIDHVNARNAALLALQKAGATRAADLELYETTEYSAVVSMRYDPVGVLLRILGEVPFLPRWLPKRRVAPGFLNGFSATYHAGGRDGLSRKVEMLPKFASQDADLLLKFFSWKSVYRKCEQDCRPLPYKDNGECFDLSSRLFLLLLGIDCLLIGYAAHFLTTSIPVMIATGAAAAGLLAFSLRKRRKIVSGLTCAFGLGMVIGLAGGIT